MTTRLITILGIAAAIAVLAVGCGSSDDETGAGTAANNGTSSPVTTDEGTSAETTTDGEEASGDKAEFIAQADAICAKTDKIQAAGVEKLSREIKDPYSLSKERQAELVLKVAIVPVRAELDELIALEVPEGEEEQVEAIFTGMEEALEKTEEKPLLINRSATNPFAEPNQLAAEYGFKECSDPL